jgi:cytochrome c
MVPLASLAGPNPLVCDAHGLVRGAEIAMENGCFGCHTLSTKRVGPAYRDVAAKYARNPVDVQIIATKIKNGGGGVWGTAVMPPNNISPEEALTLARWIQSLAQ